MATIKIPQLQRQVFGSGLVQSRANVIDVSSGLESVGRGLDQINQAIEQKKLDEDAVQLTRLQNEAAVQFSGWMKDAQDKWKRGDPDIPQQFTAAFDQWSGAAVGGFKTEKGKKAFAERMDAIRTSMAQSAIGWQAQTNKNLKLIDLSQAADDAQKLAAQNPAIAELMATQFTKDLDGINLSQVDKENVKFKYVNGSAFAAENALLDRAPESWKPDDSRWGWNNLTYEQQERMKNRHDQLLRERDAKAKAELSASESMDRAAAKDIAEAKLKGYKVSPQADQQLSDITKKYADKPWAHEYGAAAKDAGLMQEMALKPIQEQAQMVKSAREAVASGVDVGQPLDTAERLRAAAAQNRELAISNPWRYYGLTRGQDEMPPPIDFTQDVEGQIAIRNERAQLVKAGVGINPGALMQEELPAIAKYIEKAPPETALNLINSIANTDEETANATFAQIGKEAPAFGIAGRLYKTGAALDNGGSAAASLLSGYKAMRDKIVKIGKVDATTPIDNYISEEIGDMFANSPEDYQTAKNAITWLLAGGALSQGQFEYEPTTKDVKAAIRQIINPVEYGGKRVSAPVGVDASNFDDDIAPKAMSAIDAANLSPENKALLTKKHTLLDADGDGAYDLAWSSGVRVLDKDNKPIRIYYK